MNYSEDEQALTKILDNIINSTAGLKHAIIIDDTGITIISRSKFNLSKSDDISVEKIGAIGGAVFIAGEEQGQILGYEDIALQITEYSKGMIFSVKAGKGILCVATDVNVQIGFIRALLKKWAPHIAKVLEHHLQSDQGKVDKDLKELMSSDSLSFL